MKNLLLGETNSSDKLPIGSPFVPRDNSVFIQVDLLKQNFGVCFCVGSFPKSLDLLLVQVPAIVVVKHMEDGTNLSLSESQS